MALCLSASSLASVALRASASWRALAASNTGLHSSSCSPSAAKSCCRVPKVHSMPARPARP
eukprot:546949-Lingulodinium_polyedra.AAC.1